MTVFLDDFQDASRISRGMKIKELLFCILRTARIVNLWASLVVQRVKNLPAMQETQVQSQGWEDPLEKEIATPFQYFCLENSMDKGT